MDREKWNSMTDEQKTVFMRGVFKNLNFGQEFDYAECRKRYEILKDADAGGFGVFDNPCLELKLVDPVMASTIMAWLYTDYDNNGCQAAGGESSPLFGYNLENIWFNKGSLMGFSEAEEITIRKAFDIIRKKTKGNLE